MNIKTARRPGKYENFTGIIEYEYISCSVREANFELLKTKKRFKDAVDIWVIFHYGYVEGGQLSGADIEHCIFDGLEINTSIFRDGIFRRGTFASSYWLGGEWEGGDWYNSQDKYGRVTAFSPLERQSKQRNQKSGVASTEGIYNNFTGEIFWCLNKMKVENADFELRYLEHVGDYNIVFYGGKILSGKAVDVLMQYGEAKDLHWHSGVWWNGTFKDGTWEGGDWFDGIWINGAFERGTFHGGTFESGVWGKEATWRGGVWEGGEDIYGDKIETEPTSWELDFGAMDSDDEDEQDDNNELVPFFDGESEEKSVDTYEFWSKEEIEELYKGYDEMIDESFGGG